MQKYDEFINQCESDIRAGQIAGAAKRLSHLNLAEVPREWRSRFANVCRRAGLISLGLRLLHDVIHQKNPSQPPANARELAEYAVLLHRCGAMMESLQVLDRVDPEKAPEVLLYKVFGLFNMWDYEAALPVLSEYLEREQAPYMRLVGQINRVSALLSLGQLDEALFSVHELIETTRISHLGRLQANAHELRAQVYIHKRKFNLARADLELASTLISRGRTFDTFLVHKWQMILNSLERQDVQPLIQLKNEALRNREWESAREADRFKLVIAFNEEELNHLVFGTPYPKYRARIKHELGRMPNCDTYVWGVNATVILDLENGEIHGRLNKSTPPDLKCHQALEILTRDFYRGLRIGGLFSELYPGEHFNIFSSPNRVRQILHRTRLWAKNNGIPVAITESGGFYMIQTMNGLGINVSLNREPVDGMSRQWVQMKNAFPRGDSFSAAEACLRLRIPRTSLQRLIKWALKNRKLTASGKSNSILYQVTNGPVEKKAS